MADPITAEVQATRTQRASEYLGGAAALAVIFGALFTLIGLSQLGDASSDDKPILAGYIAGVLITSLVTFALLNGFVQLLRTQSKILEAVSKSDD